MERGRGGGREARGGSKQGQVNKYYRSRRLEDAPRVTQVWNRPGDSSTKRHCNVPRRRHHTLHRRYGAHRQLAERDVTAVTAVADVTARTVNSSRETK